MRPWIKALAGQAGRCMNFGPLYGIGQNAHYSYEKAGLTLHDQPIPWNAKRVGRGTYGSQERATAQQLFCTYKVTDDSRASPRMGSKKLLFIE